MCIKEDRFKLIFFSSVSHGFALPSLLPTGYGFFFFLAGKMVIRALIVIGQILKIV